MRVILTLYSNKEIIYERVHKIVENPIHLDIYQFHPTKLNRLKSEDVYFITIDKMGRK